MIRVRAKGDMIPQVLSMFRRGFDTAAISGMLEVKESVIERVLHIALENDRLAGVLLHKAEMERQQRERDNAQKDEKENNNQGGGGNQPPHD